MWKEKHLGNWDTKQGASDGHNLNWQPREKCRGEMNAFSNFSISLSSFRRGIHLSMDTVNFRFVSLPDLTTVRGEEFEVGSEHWVGHCNHASVSLSPFLGISS